MIDGVLIVAYSSYIAKFKQNKIYGVANYIAIDFMVCACSESV